MRKIGIVARHEYLVHLRRRGFLLATFVMPIVLIILLMGLVVVLIVSTRISQLGYVDQAGILAALPERQTRDVVGSIELIRYPGLDAGQAAIQSEAIQVLIVVPPDYLDTGRLDAYVLTGLPALAQPTFETVLRAELQRQTLALGYGPRVLEPLVTTHSVVLDAPQDGAGGVAGIIAPFFFSIIFLGSTFAGGSYLMSAIAEEKESKIIEILVSSLSPYQMMAGKIIGLGGLALTQLLVWTGGMMALVLIAGGLQGQSVPDGILQLLVLGIALFLPTYFIIAGTLAAIGAAVTSTQEGQQLTGVVTLLATLPVWFLSVLNNHPNGWLAIVLNSIPYTAPVTLVARVLAAPIPRWQILLTVGWLWIAAGLVILLAGRIVEHGLRHFERRLGWREVLRLFKRRQPDQ